MAVREFKNQAHSGYYLKHDLLAITSMGMKNVLCFRASALNVC